MTVVEHHSVGELQELFRQEKDARISKRIGMVWQARSGLTEPQITAVLDWLDGRCKSGCSMTTKKAWLDCGIGGLFFRARDPAGC